MRHALQWLDNHLLSLFAALLLLFIPLYPKWPLVEAIPGYIVRVRLEDFLIAAAVLWWLIAILRNKVNLGNTPLLKWIAVYLAVGLLSVMSALFLVKSLPLNPPHVVKLLLHYFRRIEYFSLYFILFSSIRTMKMARLYLSLMFLALLGVIAYGYGQKYLYWPAFSTMNREFSKGWWLYLTQHARVLSTFGGHYDLAAYLVMALSLCWSFFFGLKKKTGKIVLGLILALSFWLLILTASRISFLAYLLATAVVVLLYGRGRPLLTNVLRLVVTLGLSIVIMLSFGDLSERFTKLIKLDQVKTQLAFLKKPVKSPPEEKAVFLENNLEAVTSKSDEPPTPVRPKGGFSFFGLGSGGSTSQEEETRPATTPTPTPIPRRPIDVYEDIPLQLPATDSALATPGARTQQRTYSQTALQYDLSTGIRFDTLWPRAWHGFLRNPLLGIGYSNLTKERDDVFTEAESTDNDYLRALGETGSLGFIAFGAILFFILYKGWRVLQETKHSVTRALTIGVLAGLVGLLLNATYIDVFEASKVAMTFWSLVGITVAVWRLRGYI